MITLGAPRGLIHLRTFINGRAELADYPSLILNRLYSIISWSMQRLVQAFICTSPQSRAINSQFISIRLLWFIFFSITAFRWFFSNSAEHPSAFFLFSSIISLCALRSMAIVTVLILAWWFLCIGWTDSLIFSMPPSPVSPPCSSKILLWKLGVLTAGNDAVERHGRSFLVRSDHWRYFSIIFNDSHLVWRNCKDRNKDQKK